MATTWTVVDEVLTTEEGEWTTVLGPDTLNAQARGWTIKPAILSPNANASAQTFLGWSNFTPEEFKVIPELVTIKPAQTQADRTEWTIVAEPT